MRLNKYLSDAGVCSRREADRLTEAGESTINGKRAETGMQVESGDVVVVKGKTVVPEEKKVYLAFNKPRGIVCTAEKREKNNVIDYLSYPVRIYPVGRLDKDSEGLLLMTNDGAIVNGIMPVSYTHLAGLTQISNVVSSDIIDGVKTPCDGRLYYRGINVEKLTQGFLSENRMGGLLYTSRCV